MLLIIKERQQVIITVPQGSDIAPFLYTIYTSDLPTSEDTIVGTYADDTALLSVSSDHTIASQQIQTHLNNLSQWFTNWKIKINESKSSFITFTLRPHSCPAVSINNIDIPHSTESLNNDLKLTSINETASIFYKRFHSKLRDNPNQLINELASLTLPGNPARRLKRNWCRDLIT
ncbi:ribosome biogenesis protein TSR3 isoform X1 [Aphis craccivora]|uniref:Ribosome biogenesis protein TSR3 isoform X1 n=1 Tax=Aphis craccivora TaxID=307492 RepID=A0A6G0ZFK1_APHCR|nr:ribosome biogenesis protein TSR3 isoform X1 [Aphis craccivora]